ALAGLTTRAASAQDSVPAPEAIGRLGQYAALIQSRYSETNAIYDYLGPSGATLTAAYRKAGISQRVIAEYVSTWAEGFLSSDFPSLRSQVYRYHIQALSDSISHLTGSQEPVPAGRLSTISLGMRDWEKNETNFRSLMQKRVDLLVQLGKAQDSTLTAQS